MRIAQVHFQIKPNCIEGFIQATRNNARESLKEVGIVRFDILQSESDPTHFILFEVYISTDAQVAHKQTRHFLRWNSEVENLIIAPGRAEIFRYVASSDDG